MNAIEITKKDFKDGNDYLPIKVCKLLELKVTNKGWDDFECWYRKNCKTWEINIWDTKWSLSAELTTKGELKAKISTWELDEDGYSDESTEVTKEITLKIKLNYNL